VRHTANVVVSRKLLIMFTSGSRGPSARVGKLRTLQTQPQTPSAASATVRRMRMRRNGARRDWTRFSPVQGPNAATVRVNAIFVIAFDLSRYGLPKSGHFSWEQLCYMATGAACQEESAVCTIKRDESERFGDLRAVPD